MTYQLQLRIDDQWTTACFGEKPLALAEYAKVAKRHTTATGHRVFKADRKRLKSGELAGGPRPANGRRAPGVRPPRDLAKDVSEHIIKTKQKTIHVYPLGNTGSSISNQFRNHLFNYLTDHCGGAAAAKEFGYITIEVDPAEWVFTPDLEEAA